VKQKFDKGQDDKLCMLLRDTRTDDDMKMTWEIPTRNDQVQAKQKEKKKFCNVTEMQGLEQKRLSRKCIDLVKHLITCC